jgi:conjugative relaxase-like TrwC/TraI family protein
MARTRPIGGYSTTSHFHRQSRFPSRDSWAMTNGFFEAHARRAGSASKNLRRLRQLVFGLVAHRTTGSRATSRRQFTHDTSRALDPHLHTHCIVFNATFDPVENRWKALQNYELLRARKFAENVYYHELARELRVSAINSQSPRGDFQVEGVSEELMPTLFQTRCGD